MLPSYRNQSIAQINRLVSILGQHWNLLGYCLKHPICNSSNTNNTHTTEVVYVFVSRVKLSTCSSVKNSLRKYTVHRSLASSGISVLNSGVAVNSISVRVASPKPCLFVSYLFGDQFLFFFFFLVKQHHQFYLHTKNHCRISLLLSLCLWWCWEAFIVT